MKRNNNIQSKNKKDVKDCNMKKDSVKSKANDKNIGFSNESKSFELNFSDIKSQGFSRGNILTFGINKSCSIRT